MNLIAGFVLLTYVCAFAVPADVGERPVGGARSAVDGREMGLSLRVCPTGGSSSRERVEVRTAALPSSAPAESPVRTDAENIVWMLVSTVAAVSDVPVLGLRRTELRVRARSACRCRLETRWRGKFVGRQARNGSNAEGWIQWWVVLALARGSEGDLPDGVRGE